MYVNLVKGGEKRSGSEPTSVPSHLQQLQGPTSAAACAPTGAVPSAGLLQLRRRAHHQILGVAVEREGDGLADVRLVREEHHDAVDTRGDTAVRRGAEAERAQHAG